MHRRTVLAATSALLACGGARAQRAPLGEAPDYTDRSLTDVPNAAAIGRRIWVPGLSAGAVPQGLTFSRGELLVACYHSTSREQDHGPSAIYRVQPGSGRMLGSVALPARFGHPGGLASDAARVFAANSGWLAAAGAGQVAAGSFQPMAMRKVDKSLGPSFLSCDGTHLWFGPFRNGRDAAQPRVYAVPIERALVGTAAITEGDAVRSFPIPRFAQGATFGADGSLWLSTSAGNRTGQLLRVDPRTGDVLAVFDAPGGIEDLAHAPDGMLWAVSEAGSRRWNSWQTFYPLLFEIDPARLC